MDDDEVSDDRIAGESSPGNAEGGGCRQDDDGIHVQEGTIDDGADDAV